MPRGHPISAQSEMGERPAQEAFPLLGITPLGAVLRTQSVETGKKSRIAGSLNFLMPLMQV